MEEDSNACVCGCCVYEMLTAVITEMIRKMTELGSIKKATTWLNNNSMMTA